MLNRGSFEPGTLQEAAAMMVWISERRRESLALSMQIAAAAGNLEPVSSMFDKYSNITIPGSVDSEIKRLEEESKHIDEIGDISVTPLEDISYQDRGILNLKD